MILACFAASHCSQVRSFIWHLKCGLNLVIPKILAPKITANQFQRDMNKHDKISCCCPSMWEGLGSQRKDKIFIALF